MVIQVALGNKAKESATILDDSVLEGFNEHIQKYNPTLRAVLGKFGSSDLQLTGSSPFMDVSLINSGLLPLDARLATREDLETAISRANDFLSGVYPDFGLALRTAGDSYAPNDLPAKVLAGELARRGINLGTGKLIPLNVLSLQEDSNSAYGAVFKLNDKASKDNILGLNDLTWDYTRNEGLACASLGGGRGWGSSDRGLGDSFGYGRVVIVSGEATSQKMLDRYASKIRQDRDKAIENAQKEYSKKEALLRAK